MATEALLTSVIEQLLVKLASQELRNLRLELSRDWHNEFENLNAKISRINGLLRDAEKKLLRSPSTIKNWLSKLKGVIYKANDLLDDIYTEASRRQLGTRRENVNEVRLFLSLPDHLVYDRKMVPKMKKIRNKMNEIEMDGINLGLQCLEEPAETGRSEENVSAMASKWTESEENSDEIVFGRNDDKHAITNFLLDCNYGDSLSIISICGIGGIGKSTLAQLVFRDEQVQTHFELKLWVSLSDIAFDAKLIVERILESITGKRHKNIKMDTLIVFLHKNINEKRYLIVLDDVREVDDERWLKLKDLLLGGARGSKIIITTRSEMVARITKSRVRELSGLSVEDSWSLLNHIASKPGKPVNSKLEELGKQITLNCQGVPLAIKTVGTVLYFKDTVDEWLDVRNNELAKVDKEKGIIHTLKLNYDYLPSHLKNCFAYCVLFPKDHKFDVEGLIYLWMGQGFINSSDPDEYLEDVGLKYFRDLLWRSFFQEVKWDALGNIKSCKMNNLMSDLATSVAGIGNKVINSDAENVDEEIYHMSLGFHFDSTWQIPVRLFRARQLRTFLLPSQEVWLSNEGRWKIPDLFSNFRHLHVFDLHNSGIEKLPTSIHKMKYLRYLDVSKNDRIKSLPNSITRLKYLQVLKLSDCDELRQLPKDLRKLVNLRHLDCERCWNLMHMPYGFGQLTSLQMLTWFAVAKDSSVFNRIGGMNELNGLNLRGRIEIRNLKFVKNISEFVAANLREKQRLQSLSLCWNRDDDDSVDSVDSVDSDYDEKSLQSLQPHQNLKKLKVCDYGGMKFPDWLSSLTKLVDIWLQDCEKCDRLPQLGQIPSLKYLGIQGFPNMEYVDHEGDNFGVRGKGSTFFRSLKELYLLDCLILKGWGKNRDDLRLHFTSLSKLEIRNCPQLTSLPPFSKLDEKLLLENCSLEPLQQTIKMMIAAVPSSSSSSSSMLGHDRFKLKVLWIVSIEDLEAFPEELLQNLSSLEELHLMDCPRLSSLPLEMRGLPLRELDIRGCAQMKERYGTRKCSDWPIISRIPNIRIDGQKVQWAGSYLWDQKDSSIVTASSLSKLKTLIVEDLESLPEDWLPNLTRLQQLCLVRCPKLKSLPRGMLHLTSLQILDISQCTLHLKERCLNNKGVDWLNISHIPCIKIDGLQIQWQEQKAIEGEAAKMLSSEDILGVNTYPPGHSTPRTEVPAEKHSDPAKITTESNQLEGVPGYPQLDQKSYNDDQLAVLKYIYDYENNDNETLFEGDNCILARSRIEYWKPRQWLENNDVDVVVEAVRKEEVRERNGTNWFFPCITYESYKEVSSFKVYYDDHVQKFAVTSDLEACEKIYIPIHHYDRRHFLLAVLKVPNQTCLWYDPMWSDEGSTLTDNEILPMLLEGLENCVPGIKTKPFFPTFKEVIQKNAPRQPNGWDCGIYVMNFLRDLPDDSGNQSGKIVVNVTEGDHEKFSQALRVECLLWVLFHEANKKRDGLLLEAKKLQNKLMDSDNNSDEKEARG